MKYILIGILSLLLLVGVAGAAPYAYIANDYSNSVSVVDTTTDAVTASISVGNSPFGVACLPNGTKVYVTNLDSNTVSVIDTATNKVTDTITVGNQPRGIVVSPDGTKAYVANYGGKSVSVINLGTKKVVSTITVGNSPFGIAITPDGSKVYVANYYGASVSVISTATNRVTATISTNGYKPTRVACNPNGNAVYVTCSSKVMVINPSTNQIVKNIGTGGTSIGVTTNSNGTRVYVTNSITNGGNVVVIDASTYVILSKIPVDMIPWGISVTPDGSKVYTTSIETNRATVIDATTNTVIGYVQTGSYPASIGQFIVDIPVVPPLVAPIADFSAYPTYGNALLEVKFTDKSTGSPTSWKWDFGDGDTSPYQSPIHAYYGPGHYTVTLTVANPAGNDTFIKTNYIYVY